MSHPVTQFLAEHEATLAPLFKSLQLANWDVATTGTPEAAERAAALRRRAMTYLSDATTYQNLKHWYEIEQPTDPVVARQLKLAYLAFAGEQRDQETIQALTELGKEVQQLYVNFRGELDGAEVSDNTLAEILEKETSSERVEAAWKTSKLIGPQVADKVRRLAELRNRGAQNMGYRDYYRQSLELSEIDESRLFEILTELDALTAAPYNAAKAELDARLSARFGIPIGDLRPWHYGDPFFQRVPQAGSIDLDHWFAGRRVEDLALRTFDGVGLEVRDILDRSDLYARPGKDQHAFCTDIDREGDVRTLCNLQPTLRWVETMLHELGHAVYNKYVARDLPWLLRRHPHTMVTEAVAMLFGRLVLNPDWLRNVAGLPADEVERVAAAARERQRLAMLIFTRWVLVMAHFERALYADPRRDLDTLWWDLVERFQQIHRPEGRTAPDWAAKYHIAMAPVYYHNYLLGELIASQLQASVIAEAGALVDTAATGQFLVDRLFADGALRDWDRTVEHATGEPLTPRFFVNEFVTAQPA